METYYINISFDYPFKLELVHKDRVTFETISLDELTSNEPNIVPAIINLITQDRCVYGEKINKYSESYYNISVVSITHEEVKTSFFTKSFGIVKILSEDIKFNSQNACLFDKYDYVNIKYELEVNAPKETNFELMYEIMELIGCACELTKPEKLAYKSIDYLTKGTIYEDYDIVIDGIYDCQPENVEFSVSGFEYVLK